MTLPSNPYPLTPYLIIEQYYVVWKSGHVYLVVSCSISLYYLAVSEFNTTDILQYF